MTPGGYGLNKDTWSAYPVLMLIYEATNKAMEGHLQGIHLSLSFWMSIRWVQMLLQPTLLEVLKTIWSKETLSLFPFSLHSVQIKQVLSYRNRLLTRSPVLSLNFMICISQSNFKFNNYGWGFEHLFLLVVFNHSAVENT